MPIFSLTHNKLSINNLNQLREHCDMEQLWIEYKDGTLLRWLNQSITDEKREIIAQIKEIPNQIELINLNSDSVDRRVIQELVRILGIQVLITDKADFTQLDRYLAQGEWQNADEETSKVMLKIMDRESQGCLTRDNCENFPREELKIIDNLWVKYSDGKFGFSVQRKILMECGGEVGVYDYYIYSKFANLLGWRNGYDLKSYSNLTFNKTEPLQIGHLPSGFGIGCRSFLGQRLGGGYCMNGEMSWSKCSCWECTGGVMMDGLSILSLL
jgi:hypothetical protein